MPMRRSYRKRSSAKKRPWYKRKYNALELAAKAAKGVYYLKGLVNSETFYTIQTGTTVTNNVGAIFNLTQLGLGDGDNGRTGNSVLVRSLAFRMSCTQDQTAPSCTYRVILFWDTQQVSDGVPAVTDVLQSANPLATLTTANAGRFKILTSKMFNTSPQNPTKVIDKYYKLYKHVRWNGPTPTDIQKNGLYLLLLTDRSANAPTIQWYTKLGYHDN